MGAPRALSLEVWLGPMEGVRAVADVRGTSQILRIGRLPFDKKTELRNHVVLTACVGVSGTHAEAAYAQGRIVVRDLGSTNGTFAAEQQVTEEVEIKSGDVILISLTAILATVGPPVLAPPPFEPVPIGSWEEPSIAELLAQAREGAARRRERYVDTRHVVEALLKAREPGIGEQLAKAGVRAEDLLGEIFSRSFFAGREGWVAEILVKSVALPSAVEGEVVSPKVARLLDATRLRVPQGTASSAWGGRFRTELFAALLGEGDGAVGRWLGRKGLVPPSEAPAVHVSTASGGPGPISVDDTAPSLIQISPVAAQPSRRTTVLTPSDPSHDDGTLARPDARPNVPPRAGTSGVVASAAGARTTAGSTSARVPEAAPQPPTRTTTMATGSRPVPAPSPRAAAAPPHPAPARAATPVPAPREEPEPGAPVDAVLDGRARELAGELFALVAARRFESLDDRRTAMKARLSRELAPHGKGTRRRLLEKLRAQFPLVTSAALPDAEMVRLKKKVQELEERKAEPEKRPAKGKGEKAETTAEGLPWAELISSDEVPGGDRNLKVLQEVVRFALAMEMFVLGLVQSTTSPGDQTSQFRLPHTRDTLRLLLTQAAEGKTPSLQKVRDYLGELSHWQVACLAAYHQAPKAWFEKFWKRISPTQIESLPKSPGWKFRADEAEWWEVYRQAVKDVGPDLVQDQVLQAASRIATEEFDKLKKASEER